MTTTTEAVYTRQFSLFSIVAVIAAVLSFPVGALLGMVFAFIAILFGILGIARALSPRVRGGVASTLAIIGGLVGIVAALFKAVFFIF